MRKPRVGETALLLYFLATYVPQFVLHIVNEEVLGERFRMSAGTQHLAIFVPCFLLIVFLLNELIPQFRVSFNRFGKLAAALFQSRFNVLLGVVMIGLAVNFYFTQGISFRHSGEHLSEAGFSVQLLMLCKPYAYAWLIFHYLRAIRGERRGHGRARLQASLFLVALVISITGSLEVLPIVWFVVFVLCRHDRLSALFIASTRRFSLLARVLLMVFGAPLLGLVAVAMVWIGIVNKVGVEATNEMVAKIGVNKIAEQIMVRVSSSYASTISFAEHNLRNYSLYDSALDVPIENIPYRLSLLFGAPLPRPDVTQIMRLNYLNYELDTHLERAGASPGLVASAFFAGPFPLGFLLIGLYVVAIIRIVNLPFRTLTVRPGLAPAVLSISFVYLLFESPLDYLVFVDPALLQLLMILAAYMGAASVRLMLGEGSSGKIPCELRCAPMPR